MTINELINKLNNIENKNLPINVYLSNCPNEFDVCYSIDNIDDNDSNVINICVTPNTYYEEAHRFDYHGFCIKVNKVKENNIVGFKFDVYQYVDYNVTDNIPIYTSNIYRDIKDVDDLAKEYIELYIRN